LLWSAEGGFSVDRSGPGRILSTAPPSDELALALADFSAGLSGLRAYDRGRWGAVVATFPNTNLVAPRTVLPLLYGQHAPGDYVLACAVLATPDREIGRTVWGEPPRLPLWVPGVPAPDSP
jgi:hypothetical protein